MSNETNAELTNSRDSLSNAAPSRDGRFKDAHRPGEPAPKIGSWEEIGPPECPIMYRRTLLDLGKRVGKVLWHEFMPGASDEAHHDHPRSFLTIVLRGGYDDVREDGLVDHVYAPTIRFRRATDAHITQVGPKGATTIVLMGPLRREWGFFRDGRWYPWRTFERLFGLNWRCPQ